MTHEELEELWRRNEAEQPDIWNAAEYRRLMREGKRAEAEALLADYTRRHGPPALDLIDHVHVDFDKG